MRNAGSGGREERQVRFFTHFMSRMNLFHEVQSFTSLWYIVPCTGLCSLAMFLMKQ